MYLISDTTNVGYGIGFELFAATAIHLKALKYIDNIMNSMYLLIPSNHL